MNRFGLIIIVVICTVLVSCGTSRTAFNPEFKYPPSKLQEDYRIFRYLLEKSHPSLYWYTSKDSMDYYFDWGYSRLKDSMTESRFKSIVSFVISKVDCGHTSTKSSLNYIQYQDTAQLALFPLNLKFWDDTVVVTANINRNDTILKRGTVITSINGLSLTKLRDTLFNYVVTDGYNTTAKYQALSNFFGFGNLYSSVIGLSPSLNIHYLDKEGTERETTIAPYDARSDSLKRKGIVKPERQTGKERKKEFYFGVRSLQVDTGLSTGFMTVNTFSHGNRLKGFFRRSFKLLDERKIQSLVIDVRANGGGDATNSTYLTRYLINNKFKLADSLYAVSRHTRYGRFVEKNALYRFLTQFVTKKREDGKYHFGYFERHYFSPKKDHHFDGQVYILIGGNSFSATSLFAGSLKGQKNVTLIGEETGGGSYGNTAWIIQDVTLPNTGVRFRLPKFRLVINKDHPKNGHGVMPDVFVPPNVEAIRKGIDFKVEKTKELIIGKKYANK